MTISDAKRVARRYHSIVNPSQEEKFCYTEALDFLISKTGDSDIMVELGAFYYEQRDFTLALKYYEMAAEKQNLYAISNLGYIWYYGRTGEKNYEKAFFYFDTARKMGDLVAAYKVADMYKNGYFVEKDIVKYKQIIEDLYPKVKDAQYLGDPLPEVFTRLAKIRTEEGDIDTALSLYDQARDFLSQRIQDHPFFGDLNIMKWLIQDVYQLRKFDEEAFGLYDLFYLLQQPLKVLFSFDGDEHEIESAEEEAAIAVRLEDQWYRTIDDFFLKAELDGVQLTFLEDDLYDFRIVR